jgi:hypothetical protein
MVSELQAKKNYGGERLSDSDLIELIGIRSLWNSVAYR